MLVFASKFWNFLQQLIMELVTRGHKGKKATVKGWIPAKGRQQILEE
jgi:hypothetical protein